jgi:hypothetical protein
VSYTAVEDFPSVLYLSKDIQKSTLAFLADTNHFLPIFNALFTIEKLILMKKEEDGASGYTYIAQMNSTDELSQRYYIKSFGTLLTVFYRNQIKYPFKSPTTVFLWAIKNCTKHNLTNIIQLLLLDYRVDPSAFGDYALHSAVIDYHKNEDRAESVVKMLLADL